MERRHACPLAATEHIVNGELKGISSTVLKASLFEGVIRSSSGQSKLILELSPSRLYLQDLDDGSYYFESRLNHDTLHHSVCTRVMGMYHPDLFATKLAVFSYHRFLEMERDVRFLSMKWPHQTGNNDNYTVFMKHLTDPFNEVDVPAIHSAAATTWEGNLAATLGFTKLLKYSLPIPGEQKPVMLLYGK